MKITLRLVGGVVAATRRRLSFKIAAQLNQRTKTGQGEHIRLACMASLRVVSKR
jgi:hypothetical protein